MFLLTQVELVINSITNSKDTKDKVKQRSDRGVLTINVSGLVTSERSNGLSNLGSSLGQFLIKIRAFLEIDTFRVSFVRLPCRNQPIE